MPENNRLPDTPRVVNLSIEAAKHAHNMHDMHLVHDFATAVLHKELNDLVCGALYPPCEPALHRLLMHDPECDFEPKVR